MLIQWQIEHRLTNPVYQVYCRADWKGAVLKKTMRKTTAQYLEKVHIVLSPLVAAGLVYAACIAWGPGLSPDSVSYLSAGISLADGNGFYMYDGAPYLAWPPLIPLLAALAKVTGLPPDKAIVVTNALLFALTVFLTGALLRRYLRKRALSVWGAWAVALSPVLVIVSCQVLSDMIFTSCVVALIYALDQYATKEIIV
jgi:4-amino-4-deoxy-L-arabinose transferase-like glycosyltransferase